MMLVGGANSSNVDESPRAPVARSGPAFARRERKAEIAGKRREGLFDTFGTFPTVGLWLA